VEKDEGEIKQAGARNLDDVLANMAPPLVETEQLETGTGCPSFP
jgi:hypothetical protein